MITRQDVEGFAGHLKDRFDLEDDLQLEYRLKDGVLQVADLEIGSELHDGLSVNVKVEGWERGDRGYHVHAWVWADAKDGYVSAYCEDTPVLEAGAIVVAIQTALAVKGVFS